MCPTKLQQSFQLTGHPLLHKEYRTEKNQGVIYTYTVQHLNSLSTHNIIVIGVVQNKENNFKKGKIETFKTTGQDISYVSIVLSW